ncbi:MAG TPA: AGE family epimerase/isomerase [Rhizomicrobium sp.]|nr:AGE family epimerase/isomerase [Rhizomicrobium sp.]
MTERRIHPVVMCGGAGTRLWPASQHAHPKQFLRLTGAKSMFQQTVLRVEALATGRPVIIGNIQHADAIETQLADIGVGAMILLEPCVRDSAPAIAAAVAAIAQEDPDAIAVVVASDHYIPDDAAFREAVLVAANAAAEGSIVTLGIRPTHASTAYGYIKPGRGISVAAVAVEAFVEKPGPAKAADYMQSNYLWNSGNFIFAVDTMLNELDRHAPLVADAAKRSVRDAERDGLTLRLAASFASAPKISIDYAVMEKTECAAVLPVDFFWSDLGAWNAVHDASAKDTSGNSVSGDCTLVNVERCFVRNETNVPVAAIGISDIAIIAEPTGLLVCDLSSSQAVKSIAEKLSVGGRTAAVQPVSEVLTDWGTRYDHWLATSALPLWWSLGADHPRGGFHELLDCDGRAVPAPRRARVQARQVFVYATAAALGWQGPGREAALHGMNWFRRHYLRSDGFFRSEVEPDGRVTDETPRLYDQSFALLAMASLHALPGAPGGFREEAEALLTALDRTMRHEAGGFRESDASAFQSNPHMHLLEAALAWAEAGGGVKWEALADEIVALCLSRFIDPDEGFLREHFTAHWEPAVGERGRLVEPGHQFEWAWLLARWARRRSEPAGELAARRLFAAGARGIDPVRGVAIDALNEDLTIRTSRARLWPQTERLKAALLLHEGRSEVDDSYLAHALAAAESLWRYLEMPTRGLWRDKLTPTNRFVDEPSPASSFYHIIGAVAALEQFGAEQQPKVSLAAQ